MFVSLVYHISPWPAYSEVAQSCPTLCDPMNCSLPGSSVHGIFQTRVLEWVAISFSRRSSQPRDWTQISCIVGRCFTIWATREVWSWPIYLESKAIHSCVFYSTSWGPWVCKHLKYLSNQNCVKVKVSKSCLTLCDPMDCPWNSLGQNTRVGSLSILQGIFPTQGSNPGLPHCRQILYQLSHKGSPRILEWVAYPFSSGSSWPRNRTGVSYIAGRFFTNWAIREG